MNIKTTITTTVCALFTVIILQAGDEVTLESTPAAVQATIKKEVGTGKFSQIEIAFDDGIPEYEVTAETAEYNELEFTVRYDGALFEKKTKLTFASLPEVVRTAISRVQADTYEIDARLIYKNGLT